VALAKDVIDPIERLRPMAEKALKDCSFGLDIIAWEMRHMMSPAGPAWGIYFRIRGVLLGRENDIANITAVMDPFLTQEDLNQVVSDGCASLREALNNQRTVANGRGGK
jgi:hypothetical protein